MSGVRRGRGVMWNVFESLPGKCSADIDPGYTTGSFGCREMVKVTSTGGVWVHLVPRRPDPLSSGLAGGPRGGPVSTKGDRSPSPRDWGRPLVRKTVSRSNEVGLFRVLVL